MEDGVRQSFVASTLKQVSFFRLLFYYEYDFCKVPDFLLSRHCNNGKHPLEDKLLETVTHSTQPMVFYNEYYEVQ